MEVPRCTLAPFLIAKKNQPGISIGIFDLREDECFIVVLNLTGSCLGVTCPVHLALSRLFLEYLRFDANWC